MIQMPRSRRPVVLIVDDEIDEAEAYALELRETCEVTIRHPNALRRRDLTGASVVLVDLLLDNWVERDEIASIAMRPMDGLAVVRVLQSYRKNTGLVRPQAYALLSANLLDISGGSPAASREHSIAPNSGDV